MFKPLYQLINLFPLNKSFRTLTIKPNYMHGHLPKIFREGRLPMKSSTSGTLFKPAFKRQLNPKRIRHHFHDTCYE